MLLAINMSSDEGLRVRRNCLASPVVTVLEAAVRCGFSDQSHFTKIFRRIVGVTPTWYRAAL
jgi:AraC-like DNA-binding protein